jgi:hypothetical protein
VYTHTYIAHLFSADFGVVKNVFSENIICPRVYFHVKFKVFRVVNLEITVLWVVIPCVARDMYWRFRETLVYISQTEWRHILSKTDLRFVFI